MLAEGEGGSWQRAERLPAYQNLASLAVGGGRGKAGRGGGGRGGAALELLARLSRGARVAAGAVLLLLVVGVVSAQARWREGRLIRSYEAALLDAAAGKRPPAELLAGDRPSGREAQLLWIRVHAEDDVLAGVDSAMAAQGLSGFDPPPEWLTFDYFRNPRGYPEIGEHWEAYNRFHATYASQIPRSIERAVFRWSDRAGLRPPFTNELTDRIDAEMGTRMRPFYIRSDIAGAALELHRSLTTRDGRIVVRPDEGVLEFSDLGMLNGYNRHLLDLRRATQEMTVFSSELNEQQVAMLNAQMGRYIDPGPSDIDRAVDRAILDMRRSRGARREGVPIQRPPRRPPY